MVREAEAAVEAAIELLLRQPGTATQSADPEESRGTTAPVNLRPDMAQRVVSAYATLSTERLVQYPYATDLIEENWQLATENALLRARLDDFEARLARLEADVPETKVVVLRQITRDEAKQEIKELFASGETLDYEDIVDRLQLDLELVVGICDELTEEGEIGPDA